MSDSGNRQAPVSWSAWPDEDPLQAAPPPIPPVQEELPLASVPAPVIPAQQTGPPPVPVAVRREPTGTVAPAGQADARSATSSWPDARQHPTTLHDRDVPTRTWTTADERMPEPREAVAAAAAFPRLPPAAPPATTPAPPRPASGGGVSRRALVGIAVVCLLAGGGGATIVVGATSDGSAGDGVTTESPDGGSGLGAAPAGGPTPDDFVAEEEQAEPSTQAAPTSAAGPTEEQAVRRLEALRSTALQTLALDGRWVAQVASKSIGITDPLQVAQNGTHTFYAVDILAESEAAAVVAGPSNVLLLTSMDFGKRSTAADGQPYWVTVVDAGFGSADGVNAWCAQTFAALSPAELANACAPRTLSPPHG